MEVIIALLCYCGIALAVQFTEQPQTQIVEEGGTAIFACGYTGTLGVPFWIINGTSHFDFQLPTRHSYSNRSLVVSGVKLFDNASTYQCSFGEVSSKIAILLVTLPAQITTATIYGDETNETSTEIPLATTAEDNSTTTVNTQTKTEENGVHIDESLNQIPETSEDIFAPIIGAVTTFVMIVLVCVTLVAVMRKCFSKKSMLTVSANAEKEAIYEEVKEPIQVYKLIMTENESYAQTGGHPIYAEISTATVEYTLRCQNCTETRAPEDSPTCNKNSAYQAP